MRNAKALATSGWYFGCRKAPLDLVDLISVKVHVSGGQNSHYACQGWEMRVQDFGKRGRIIS